MANYYSSSGYSHLGPNNAAAQQDPSSLSFYSPSSSSSQFYNSRPSLDPDIPRNQDVVAGSITPGALGGGISTPGLEGNGGANGGTNGPIMVRNWWNAFTPWTGIEGQEPPLLQELGINFDHILAKSLTVLNPLKTVDPHIMDDADLAGPLVFCFVFACFLLLSGKPQFSYIYGVALIGSASMYALLNLMSESGIDAHRTASVLGYCILPLVLLSMFNVVLNLDGMTGYLLSSIFVLWSTYSSSSIFATVLHLSHQRFLVAYPVGLLYSAFSLFVFEVQKK
ncbi:transporter YIP1 [Sporobolomyces salmoneus]|uniref:transporter YIP1 n=1 Tax=Sporobolomyces salmoneus TaxID=183962 RepID=UPI00317A55D3